MVEWPSGWREATLRAAGIPVSPFTVGMISAWQKSTPLQPWTNNPLGVPTGTLSAPSVFGTRYAQFASMSAFRDAFTDLLSRPSYLDLRHALTTQDKPTVVWRAIHALDWPANITESEYPSAILDLVTSHNEVTTSQSSRTKRKSSGLVGPQSTDIGDIIAVTQQAGDAIRASMGVRSAIASVLGKLV